MTLTLPAALRLTASPAGVGGQLRGLGAARPSGRMTAADLAARVDRTADWIAARTGIRELGVLAPGETLTDLAVGAARAAIQDAGIDAARIDLVIGASCSRHGEPPLAAALARELAPAAAGFDLNAACAGFTFAVSNADAMVRAGRARHVLVVAAERMAGVVDPHDVGTSILFGDGAGAAVVGPAPDAAVHIGPPVWGSDGGQAGLIEIPDGGRFLQMAGRQVFRWAVGEMPALAREACRRAGVTLADIDVFVPHQANARIVDAVATSLGLEHAVARDVVTTGNTSAASIPLALHRLRAGGQHRGQLALLVGFGAGLAYAAQVVRLP